MREAKAGVLVATGGTAASVVVDAVEASPRVVVVVVAVGSEVWPLRREGKVEAGAAAGAAAAVVVAGATLAVVVVVAAGVKSEAPAAGFVGKAKDVCWVGAADLAGSATVPMVLAPNCRAGVAVEAGAVVGSWKLEENPPLAVVAVAGAEKLKVVVAEDAGVARKPPLGAAGCWLVAAAVNRPPPPPLATIVCWLVVAAVNRLAPLGAAACWLDAAAANRPPPLGTAACWPVAAAAKRPPPLDSVGCWVVAAAAKSPPPVVAAAVVAVAGVEVVPKLKGEAPPEACEAKAVPKLKLLLPLLPPAVEVVRVGKLKPPPVVLGADPPKLKDISSVSFLLSNLFYIHRCWPRGRS